MNTRNLVIRLELCQKFDANARQILNTTESVLNMRCSKVVSKSQIEKFQKMNQENSMKTDSSVGSSSMMKIGDSGNGSDMTEAKIQQRKRTQSGSEMQVTTVVLKVEGGNASKMKGFLRFWVYFNFWSFSIFCRFFSIFCRFFYNFVSNFLIFFMFSLSNFFSIYFKNLFNFGKIVTSMSLSAAKLK